MTSTSGSPARRALRAVAYRVPGLGGLLRERSRLRIQQRVLLQDAENLRVAVGQLLTEVHKYRAAESGDD